MSLTADVMDDNFHTDSVENIQKFIKNLVGFYVIMEGIFFYSGFVMILSFHRQNKMVGIGEQFQYILRDESIHMNFGIDLINGIKAENPDVWTESFQQEILDLIQTAVDYEIKYAKDCLPNGVMGLKADQFEQYVRYIANRRVERIGLEAQYPGATNPFPWMSEVMDLQKEKNFFRNPRHRLPKRQQLGVVSAASPKTSVKDDNLANGWHPPPHLRMRRFLFV